MNTKGSQWLCSARPLVMACAMLWPKAAAAQAAGTFIIPAIRSSGSTDFAYWNSFYTPASSSYNYNHPNAPALFLSGSDTAGNVSNLLNISLFQTGTPTCFVTSSGALYSFAGTTAFAVPFDNPSQLPVNNVIFQTQTGGRRFDIENIRLEYTDSNAVPQSLSADYKALDDPQSGSFSERLVSAFQWDLSGKGVQNFRLVFSAPGSSMPLWEAQLDVVRGAPFVRQLGFLIIPRSLPITEFGVAGGIEKNLPAGSENRYHLPGDLVPMIALPEAGWSHVGWLQAGTVVQGEGNLAFTMPSADTTVTALFAPETYADWRNSMFRHANSLLGQSADNLDDAISGPNADPDADGITNYAEYAFGGKPYIVDSQNMRPECLLVSAQGTVYPAIRYRVGTGGFTETYYRVSYSQNLASWTDNDASATPVTAEIGREVQPDGTMLVTTRSTLPVSSQAKQFFRITAE